MAGDQRQGWAIFAAMAGVLVVGAIVAMAGETGGNPLFPAGVDQQLGNMEGKESRIGSGAGGLMGRDHDRHEHRRGERDARQLPAHRGAGAALPHPARRGRSGRRRRGPVRDARPRRDPVGVHRRAHGRSDARVPRQEGRELRDEDGDARRRRARREHPRLHGSRDRDRRGPGRAAQRRPARLQRDPVRVLEPDRQQRLGDGGADRQHALLQHRLAGWRCSSAASR